MRKNVLILALSLLALGSATRVCAQSSTEGKEFWVSSTIVCQPPTASAAAVPYIAVSAKQACTVSIQDYQGNVVVAPTQVAAGSWTEFKTIPANKWYPTNIVSAENVHNEADQKHNYGLHVIADEDISVFVVVRATNSMDASNILPTTALQSEYYTQDFKPEANGVSTNTSMITILGTADNTTIDITPSENTYGKTNKGTTFQISLNKGQTYYLISAAGTQLAGTHIEAKNGKPIAVFCGDPLTRNPEGVSARDAMFEQMMPVDYWGSHFIATRSLGKDGNVVGLTALEDGTQIKLNGTMHKTINHGETYYFVLQSVNNPYGNKPGTSSYTANDIISADVVDIQTSCPCACISYDTGNSFAAKTGSEIEDSKGDPSSVWLAPVEQSISEITFGACYTDKTTDHYLNVVTPTATASNTKLTAYLSGRAIDMSTRIDTAFKPVPFNPSYSYARIAVSIGMSTLSTFTLKNSAGVIAHVYGNGEDESYAYSCGSSAIKRGIKINGVNFTDGYIFPDQFCIRDSLSFDAQVGSDIITAVDWDFGDGITELQGNIQTSHQYLTPGWFDASAKVRATKACSDETYPVETIHFAFYINLPDTVGRKDSICYPDPWPYDGKVYDHDTIITYDDGACDTIYRYMLHVGHASPVNEWKEIAVDSFQYDGTWYYKSQDIEKHYLNIDQCDSTVLIHLTVQTALDLTINSSIYDCVSDKVIFHYMVSKGDYSQISDLSLIHQGKNIQPESLTRDSFVFASDPFRPGTYKDTVYLSDTLTKRELRLPVDLEIYFPSSVFEYKYNNVLAVLRTGWNGGYEFRTYQWFLNDSPITNANASIYHTTTPFTDASYYVYLTGTDTTTHTEVAARSCAQEIKAREYQPATDDPNTATTQKRLIRNRLYIFRSEDEVYDAYGRRVR